MPTAGWLLYKKGIISTQLLSSPTSDLVGDALSQHVPCTCRDLCQRAYLGWNCATTQLHHTVATVRSKQWYWDLLTLSPPFSPDQCQHHVDIQGLCYTIQHGWMWWLPLWEQQQPGKACTLLFNWLGLSLKPNYLSKDVDQNFQLSSTHLNNRGASVAGLPVEDLCILHCCLSGSRWMR